MMQNIQNDDTLIRVFIGFDARETVAYHALCQSIIAHSSKPVAFTPIVLEHLQGIFKRERHSLQSTDFSFSRFLVPYLSDYKGWSIFMDCDMLARDDIAKLWDLRDDKYSAMCVKHNHVPKETKKFLGEKQSEYQKKNWSSMILFNNAKCQALTLDYVNNKTGLELHQFKWLENDDLIGGIDSSWNHLVGYENKNNNVQLVHYTLGGPYFDEYHNCDFAEEWGNIYKELSKPYKS